MTNHRNWIVQVSVDDTDPAQYGPYTRRRAEEVAEQAERRLARAGRDDIIAVTAFPIQPYGVTGILGDFGVALSVADAFTPPDPFSRKV